MTSLKAVQLALSATAVALTACGAEQPWTCEGSGYKAVESDHGFDEAFCAEFNMYADEARRLLIDSEVFTEKQVMDARAAFGVKVHDGSWEALPGRRVSGWTTPEGTEVNSRQLGILVHEQIHAIELQHFQLNTAFHPGWEEKGYLGLPDLLAFMHNRTRWCEEHKKLAPESRTRLIATGWPVEAWEQKECK